MLLACVRVCEYRRVVRCACPTPLGTRRPYRTPSKETERRFYFFPFLSLPFLACRTRALRLIYSRRPLHPLPPYISSALPPAIVYFIPTHERSRLPVPGFPGQLQDAASFMGQLASLFSVFVGPERRPGWGQNDSYFSIPGGCF